MCKVQRWNNEKEKWFKYEANDNWRTKIPKLWQFKKKLENYNLNIENKSKPKPAEIKLESQEIDIKKEPIEPMDL